MYWRAPCPDGNCNMGGTRYWVHAAGGGMEWAHSLPPGVNEAHPASKPTPIPPALKPQEVSRAMELTWGTEVVVCPEFLVAHTETCTEQDRRQGATDTHEYRFAYNPALLKKRVVPRNSLPIFWCDHLGWAPTPMQEKAMVGGGDKVKAWPAITLAVTDDTSVRFTGAYGDPNATKPKEDWQWLEITACPACTHNPDQCCEVRVDKGRVFHVPCMCENCTAAATHPH